MVFRLTLISMTYNELERPYRIFNVYKLDKNLAIANISRVSCAHNSSRESPWP